MWRWSLVVMLLLAAASFAYYVWPTPWVYSADPSQGTSRRWNRITHENQQLVDSEWRPVPSEGESDNAEGP